MAGFFDGEGSLVLRSGAKQQLPRPIVSIGQKDPTILLWMRARIGGGIVQTSTGFALRISNVGDVYAFLRGIKRDVKDPKKRRRLRLAVAMLEAGTGRGISPAQREKRLELAAKW